MPGRTGPSYLHPRRWLCKALSSPPHIGGNLQAQCLRRTAMRTEAPAPGRSPARCVAGSHCRLRFFSRKQPLSLYVEFLPPISWLLMKLLKGIQKEVAPCPSHGGERRGVPGSLGWGSQCLSSTPACCGGRSPPRRGRVTRTGTLSGEAQVSDRSVGAGPARLSDGSARTPWPRSPPVS